MTYKTYFSKRILITSGPTQAPLDAVRFLSNRSTGRFGTLLAEEALRRQAQVTMVYGRGSETPSPHHRLRLIPVETHAEVTQVLRKELVRFHYDAMIHSMAVLDFRPERIRAGKTGSREGGWVIRLVPTEKIILKIKRWAPDLFLVGFKLEVGRSFQKLVGRGRRLLKESGADLVIANQLTAGDDSRHAGYLVNTEGKVIKKVVGKRRLAKAIIRSIPVFSQERPRPDRVPSVRP